MTTNRPVLCRVCTVPTAPETSWNVFDSQVTTEGYTLAQLIALVGAIEVRPEETDLSAWCCFQCQLDVGIAYRVRLLCQESDRKLREMLLEGSETIESGATVLKMEVEELTEGNLGCEEDGVLIEYNAESEAEVSNLEEECSSSQQQQNPQYSNIFEEIPNSKKRCCGCDQLFASAEELLEHSKREHAVFNPPKATTNRELCNVCYRLVDGRYLESHKESPKTLFRCLTCGGMFFTKTKAISHHITEHDSTTTCYACSLRFDSTEAHELHFEQVHVPLKIKADKKKPTVTKYARKKVAEKDKFKCSKCPKLLATREALEFHEHGHQDPFSFKCTRCAMVFTNYYAYKSHSSSHRAPKEDFYVCETCGFRFKFHSSLRKHVAKYCSTSKQHKCQHCPASYACQFELSRHVKTAHQDLVEELRAPEADGQQSDQPLDEAVTELVEVEGQDTLHDDDDEVFEVEVEEIAIRSPEGEEENENAESFVIGS